MSTTFDEVREYYDGYEIDSYVYKQGGCRCTGVYVNDEGLCVAHDPDSTEQEWGGGLWVYRGGSE